jgi:pimeloyl-ACP methyl ester carboxylesterase
MIHGYQASPDIFSGLREFLSSQRYSSTTIDYDSEKGIAPAAAELSKYLGKRTLELKAEGIQVKRFDLIAHSMGGLVARYYTCSEGYLFKNNVRKLIFISVPQKGSPFASLGLQYYSGDSIRDMATESELMTVVFPSMINSGLNPSIETANILDRFDEVVSVQNASLAEWKINTEIFDVGESNLTVDKLMNGEILKATNHKRILYNMKIYQKLSEMLGSKLPYPTSVSK